MRGKVLGMSLVASVLSVISFSGGGTLAYLVDSDAMTATFAAGQVKARMLTAAVGRTWIDDTSGEEVEIRRTDEEIAAAAAVYGEYDAENCVGMLGGDVCEKKVYVQNTGGTEAYVRVRVLIPQALTAIEAESGVAPVTVKMTESDEYEMTSNEGVECGDEICDEYVFTRTQALSGGEMVENPVMEAITYNVVAVAQGEPEEGAEAESEIEVESPVLTASTAGIRIYAEAIQAKGFMNAEEAFDNF